jgi:Flp pilus assembly protein TadG
MKIPISSSPPTERGQSLVEFGISLIVLLMLLTGAVETSLALFQYVTLRDAAQEGALFGSIAMANTSMDVGAAVRGIEWRAIQTADDVVTIPPEKVRVFINGTEIFDTDTSIGEYCEGKTDGKPNTVTVTTTFDHPITFPFVEAMIGRGTVVLTASATNTILQPACVIAP